jgi:hypothetical protein
MLVTTGGGREARRRCSIHASAARAWALGAILALAIASFAAADGDASAAAEPVDPVETVRPMMSKPFSIAQLRSAIERKLNTCDASARSKAACLLIPALLPDDLDRHTHDNAHCVTRTNKLIKHQLIKHQLIRVRS